MSGEGLHSGQHTTKWRYKHSFCNTPDVYTITCPCAEVRVNITSGNQVVSEALGEVEVCVELNHSPLVPVFVTLTAVSGTAQSKTPHIFWIVSDQSC